MANFVKRNVPPEILLTDFRTMSRSELPRVLNFGASNKTMESFYCENPAVYLDHVTSLTELYKAFDGFLGDNRNLLSNLRLDTDSKLLYRMLSRLVSIDRTRRYVNYIVKNVLEHQIPRFKKEDAGVIFTPITDSFPVMFSQDLAIYGYSSEAVRRKYFNGEKYLQDSLKPMFSEFIKSARYNDDFEESDFRKRILRTSKVELARKYGPIVFVIDKILQNDNTDVFITSMSFGLGDYYLHLIVSQLSDTPISDYNAQLSKLRRTSDTQPNSQDERVLLLDKRFNRFEKTNNEISVLNYYNHS